MGYDQGGLEGIRTPNCDLFVAHPVLLGTLLQSANDPHSPSVADLSQIIRLRQEGLSLRGIAERVGVSHETARKVLRKAQ